MIAPLAALLLAQSGPFDIPVLLRRDISHRVEHVYFMDFTMTMKATGVPMAEEMGEPMHTRGYIRMVLEPVKNGPAKLTTTISGMEVSHGGQTSPAGGGSTVSVMSVDSLNQVRILKGSGAGIDTSMMLGGFGSPTFPASFPVKKVRFGESWPLTMSSAPFFKGESTYLGEEEVGGFACSRVMSTVEMSLGEMLKMMSNPMMESMNPQGVVSGVGYTYYSKADGDVVYSYMNVFTKFDMSAQGQDVKMKMNFMLELRRLS